MSKISSVVSGLVKQRSYSVYARAVNVHVSAAAAAGRTTTDGGAADGRRATSKKQDVFWMRDQKTGCWIPENRFQEVDVVELRNQLGVPIAPSTAQACNSFVTAVDRDDRISTSRTPSPVTSSPTIEDGPYYAPRGMTVVRCVGPVIRDYQDDTPTRYTFSCHSVHTPINKVASSAGRISRVQIKMAPWFAT